MTVVNRRFAFRSITEPIKKSESREGRVEAVKSKFTRRPIIDLFFEVCS